MYWNGKGRGAKQFPELIAKELVESNLCSCFFIAQKCHLWFRVNLSGLEIIFLNQKMRCETVFSANKRKKKIQKSKIETLSPEYQKEIFFSFQYTHIVTDGTLQGWWFNSILCRKNSPSYPNNLTIFINLGLVQKTWKHLLKLSCSHLFSIRIGTHFLEAAIGCKNVLCGDDWALL